MHAQIRIAHTYMKKERKKSIKIKMRRKRRRAIFVPFHHHRNVNAERISRMFIYPEMYERKKERNWKNEMKEISICAAVKKRRKKRRKKEEWKHFISNVPLRYAGKNLQLCIKAGRKAGKRRETSLSIIIQKRNRHFYKYSTYILSNMPFQRFNFISSLCCCWMLNKNVNFFHTYFSFLFLSLSPLLRFFSLRFRLFFLILNPYR